MWHTSCMAGLTKGSGATGSVFVNDQACSGPVMFMKPHPGADSRSSSSMRNLRSSPPLAAGACAPQSDLPTSS